MPKNNDPYLFWLICFNINEVLTVLSRKANFKILLQTLCCFSSYFDVCFKNQLCFVNSTKRITQELPKNFRFHSGWYWQSKTPQQLDSSLIIVSLFSIPESPLILLIKNKTTWKCLSDIDTYKVALRHVCWPRPFLSTSTLNPHFCLRDATYYKALSTCVLTLDKTD